MFIIIFVFVANYGNNIAPYSLFCDDLHVESRVDKRDVTKENIFQQCCKNLINIIDKYSTTSEKTTFS